MTVGFIIVLRDSAHQAEAVFGELVRHNRVTGRPPGPTLLGRPSDVAAAIAPFRDLGFSTVVCRMPAPYDHETIDRIGEVASALGG